MSNLKQKHKDYLIKNEIKDLTDLVNYVEILRNTSNLEGEDKQMLFDFAFLITNEQLYLKSFFAENKNPSNEFYNAFKQSISSPTFMDEVINDLQGNKIEMHKFQEQKTETHTEVPKFTLIDIEQISPKHVFDSIEKQEEEHGVKENKDKTDYSEIDFDTNKYDNVETDDLHQYNDSIKLLKTKTQNPDFMAFVKNILSFDRDKKIHKNYLDMVIYILPFVDEYFDKIDINNLLSDFIIPADIRQNVKSEYISYLNNIFDEK